MRTIQASEFRRRSLTLIDEVAAGGEPLLITKHGRPMAELWPHKPPRAKSLIGLDKGRIRVLGDIVAPAYEGKWDALK